MPKGRHIQVAGPTDNPLVGGFVRDAKTLIAVRERIGEAARSAIPPHKRRPAKGAGRWPGRIRPGDIAL